MELTIQAQGPNARAVLQATTDFFRDEYGEAITIAEAPATEAETVKGDPATMLAILSLVVALPGALVALLDLRERAAKRKQTALFVRRTRELMTSPEDHLSITVRETETFYLRSDDPEQLFDALASVARKEQARD